MCILKKINCDLRWSNKINCKFIRSSNA